MEIRYVDVVHNSHYSFLLGTEFLVKSGTRIDLATLQAIIGLDKIPVSVVNRPSQVKVCITESLQMPARSEALLTGYFSGLHGMVMDEPKYEISTNDSWLYPARSVAYVENESQHRVRSSQSFHT